MTIPEAMKAYNRGEISIEEFKQAVHEQVGRIDMHWLYDVLQHTLNYKDTGKVWQDIRLWDREPDKK